MIEKYDDHVNFTETKGKSHVTCLKCLADLIVNSLWHEKREKDLSKESERIINTAAKLILSDIIRSMNLESDIYPTETEICESLLLESLRKFLEVLMKEKLKRSSVGQVIISAARPRSGVLPITFGIGVEMDNMFGSRWLINGLSKLGFSDSYDEIKRYKQSVISNDDSLSAVATRKPDFVRWVADNVDHNISNAGRKKHFSRYGDYSCIHWKIMQLSNKDPQKKRKSMSEAAAGKAIPIKQYLHDGIKALASINFKSIKDLTYLVKHISLENLTSSGKWGIFSRNRNLIGPVLCRDI